jgi:hypothetical protein
LNWHFFGFQIGKEVMKKITPYFLFLIFHLINPEAIHPQGMDAKHGGSHWSGSGLKIYPNPISSGSYLYVQMDSCQACSLENLSIFNEAGFLLKRFVFRNQKGLGIYRVNISGLAPGRYVAKSEGYGVPGQIASRLLDID